MLRKLFSRPAYRRGAFVRCRALAAIRGIDTMRPHPPRSTMSKPEHGQDRIQREVEELLEKLDTFVP